MTTDVLSCPVCSGQPLTPFSWNGTTVDVCDHCHGIWFDFGEMQQVADSATLEAVDAAFKGEYQESLVEPLESRQCPVDGTPLERHEWAEDSQIVMDYCPLCSGTWLDAGELEGYTALIKKRAVPLADVEAIVAETRAQAAQTRHEIDAWVNGVDMGFITDVSRVVGAVQRRLGLNRQSE